MPRYTTNSKQVLRDGKHFADCIDDGAARLVADSLNERRGMPQTQQVLPLDGADGPLFVNSDDPLKQLHSDVEIAKKEAEITRSRNRHDASTLNGRNRTEQLQHELAALRQPHIARQEYTRTNGVGLQCTSCNRPRDPYRECPRCTHTHTVRQESDEYACSCGTRWDVADGENHP